MKIVFKCDYRGREVTQLAMQRGFWIKLKYGILYNKTLEEAKQVIDYISNNRPEMFDAK